MICLPMKRNRKWNRIESRTITKRLKCIKPRCTITRPSSRRSTCNATASESSAEGERENEFRPRPRGGAAAQLLCVEGAGAGAGAGAGTLSASGRAKWTQAAAASGTYRSAICAAMCDSGRYETVRSAPNCSRWSRAITRHVHVSCARPRSSRRSYSYSYSYSYDALC